MRPPAADDASAETLAFLQHRVATFGLTAGGLGLLFLAYRASLLLVHGQAAALADPTVLYHFAGAGFMLAIWALCRSGTRSRRFVAWVEAVGLVASALCYAAMGSHIPLVMRPELIVLLAVTFGLVARAIYVPSTPLHTVALALAIGLALVPAVYVGYLDADSTLLDTIAQQLGGPLTRADVAFYSALELFAWWTLVTILAGATTRVVHGLRREVRAARRLGQYVLEGKLGEGGMGVVYRAGHAMLRRPAAVKLLPPERSSERDVLRFEREVQLTARLTHPNTVTVFDYGRTTDGVFYYAMELLEGASLDVAVRATGPFPRERVLHVLHGVAGALTEAHAIGLIHRDLKPSNIILCDRGGIPDVPKVVDFGLVKDLQSGPEAALTQAEALTGTPLYMSPESIRTPDQVDARSDLYSLGAVGYFLLTGGPVFGGQGIVEVCAHHLHTPPEPPSRRTSGPVPADLEAILLDCLAKAPAERPSSATALRERLEACEGFGEWTELRAREWWSRHAEALAERTELSEGPRALTAFTTLSR